MRRSKSLPALLIVTSLFWSCGRPEANKSTVQDKEQNEDTASVEETDTSFYIKTVPQAEKLARYHIVKKESIEKDKVSLTEFFDANGKTIKTISENFLTTFTYNKEGKLISEVAFKNGKKYHETIYTLNEQGQTLKETMMEEEEGGRSMLQREKIHFYTGKRTDSTHSLLRLSDHDLLENTKFYYDKSGRLTKRETMCKNGGPWYFSDYSVYTYNRKTGLLDSESWHSFKENGDRQFDATVEYSYNEFGDLTRKVNDALGMIQSYDYDYNEQGLLVKVTQVNPQNTQVTIYRYSTK